jgi:hypothetical protein
MRLHKLIIFLLIFQVALFSLQLRQGYGASIIQINSVTPVNSWGNVDYYLDRGFLMTAVVNFFSQYNATYLVSATLFDNCNTPVGFGQKRFDLLAGNNVVFLDFLISGYAYVGLGNLHITVSQLDSTPISSFDLTIYIDILGDFNKDNSINSLDIAYIMTGYNQYWASSAVPSNYQSCDITGDNRINNNDLTAFAVAYITYWSCR